MGQKIHPIGFRVGISEPWRSRWIARKAGYGDLVLQDRKVRKMIRDRFRLGVVSRIDIERRDDRLNVIIHCTRKGEVIGRGYATRDQLVVDLQKMTNLEVKLDIQEVRNWDLDAQSVAENLAGAIERRVSARRQIKRVVENTMNAGASGVKVEVKGRIDGADMGRRLVSRAGRVPLQTLKLKIDYGFAEAKTTYGVIGVKVWVFDARDQEGA